VLLIALGFLGLEMKMLAETWPAAGTDFSIYYRAALDFREDPSLLYKAEAPGFDQYLYPPPSILLFSGFSLMPIQTAYMVFIGLMYVCLVASLLLARSLCRDAGLGWTRWEFVAFAFLALASAPVYHNISLGQVNSLVLFLSLLYLFLLNRQKPVAAGIVLAIAIWIKLYPALLLLAAFDRKNRKAVLSCAAAGILIPALLLPFVPFSLYEGFAGKFLQITKYTSGHIINQSFTAFLYRFGMSPERIFLWPNIFETTGWIKMLNLALLALLLLLTWVRRRPGTSENRLLLGAVLLSASAVFSNLGWGHTYLLSLPLLMAGFPLLRQSIRSSVLYYLFVLLISALYLIPVHNHPSLLDRLPFFVQNIYYSRLLWLTLFLVIIVLISRKGSTEAQAQRDEARRWKMSSNRQG
jgi:uncharacterized membrane protein